MRGAEVRELLLGDADNHKNKSMQKTSAVSATRNAFFLLTVFTISFAAQSPSAQAQTAKGTSAYTAARLKNHPPKNWIRHYLGDDRYKIAGGVWKVVSTELDRFYYPAWAPEMLRQPAGIVIGFSSAAEAEEAGYRPSIYGASDSLYGLTAAEIAAAKKPGGSFNGKRITLSDGASSVILPTGWKHTRIGGQNMKTQAGAMTYQGDLLTPSGGKSGIMFMVTTMPGNINVESFLSPQKVAELRTQMQQRAGADTQFGAALEGAKIGVGKLGGLTGITIIPGNSAKLPAGMGGIMTIVGRGPKMYMMAAQLASTDRNYGVVVNSFQPR